MDEKKLEQLQELKKDRRKLIRKLQGAGQRAEVV